MRAQMTKNAVIVPAGAKGGFYLKPAARRTRRSCAPRSSASTCVHRRACSTSPTTSSTARSSIPRACACSTRTTPTSSSPPTRARRRCRTRPTGSREALRVLARRRVRVGRLERLRPQGARHHRPRRVGVGQAPLPRARPRPADRRRSRSSGSATCRATCSATGCCCRSASGSSPPTTTATSSSTRTPTRTAGSPSASGCSSSPARAGTTTTATRSPRAAASGRAAAKSIPLSPEVRAALGVEDEALAPTDVIRAILRAPVDVLWNGGIGTVVKASFETDADAHDRSSDAIRVDASDLRCRVVAEGGNLGLTQRARIEFAAGGGRINADFIDNSAGVDCSDHEVNLKILLNVAVAPRRARRRGPRRAAARGHRRRRRPRPLRLVPAGPDPRPGGPRLGRADVRVRGPHGGARGRGSARPRHRVPAELGGDGRAPAREPRPRAARARRPARLRQARADRRAAALGPRRRSRSSSAALRGYFPPLVVDRFGHLLDEHPLRRELVATIVANHVIDALGPTFVAALMVELGAEPADVVRAYPRRARAHRRGRRGGRRSSASTASVDRDARGS